MTYTITQITQAKKNTERVNIFINNQFWIGLAKNDLIALKLLAGKVLSELEKGEIENTATNQKLIDKAIRYLQIRPRSCAEIHDYLVLKKGIPTEDAENVIAYLQQKELLSDERFAEWYIDYKLNNGINGINKIKMELLKKGVTNKIITAAFENLSTNEDYNKTQLIKIDTFAKKVISQIKAKTPYELKTKLIQRLMARGFKYEDIKKVIK